MQPHRHILSALVAFCALHCALAQTPGSAPSNFSTGIAGVVTLSPVHGGPEKIGIPNSKPLAKTYFVVKNERGEASATFTTDEKGHFKIPVPPGHYIVSLKESKRGPGRWGPFEVYVTAGKVTDVEWNCDSGMR